MLAHALVMPTSREILDDLRLMTHDVAWLSVAWHVVAAITIALLLAGFRPTQRMAAASLGIPLASVSIVALAFGWVYPHFLEGSPWYAHLYGAPMGVIPCPTLSAVVGVALVAGGFGARAWRLTLASAASFYSLFGILALGVAIDAALLLGGLGLLAQHVQDRARRSGPVRSESRRLSGTEPSPGV